jgi:hypothetical protein
VHHKPQAYINVDPEDGSNIFLLNVITYGADTKEQDSYQQMFNFRLLLLFWVIVVFVVFSL